MFNLASEYSVPGASSARCASRRTNWNLLPSPHCGAERSQAPPPAPPRPQRPWPARPHSGFPVAPALGAGPAPRAGSVLGWGGSAVRPASRRPARRVEPGRALAAGWELSLTPRSRRASPASARPGRCPSQAAGTRRPVGPARAVCALWSPGASGERRPASPATPHPEMHGSLRAEWQDFGCRGPVTWPGGAQLPATAFLPNPVSFPPNPLSAGDGFLLFLVGVLAGLGVPPRQERAPSWPQPPAQGLAYARRSRKKCLLTKKA